jgi:hypothetical protein
MRNTHRLIFGFLTGASICACASAAVAQVNCEAIPAGPARTDCYIGLARIGGGNAAIAGAKAQLAADKSILRQTTGQSVKKKSRKKSMPRVN